MIHLNINKGDYVTRNSYHNDVVFKVVNIEDGLCYLKGVEIRLYADSPITDLIKCEKPEEEELKPKDRSNLVLEDKNYFYLPGRILHIEADFFVTDTLANPYRIRENG